MTEINEKQALNGVISVREELEGGYIIPKGEKGDKGDPFTYNDFTPEQLALLTGPKGEKGDKGDKGAQGIKGDKGDKGDPGGINVAIVKEEGLDLNDFIESGVCFFSSAYTPLNAPANVINGWLEVFSSNTPNSIKQIWYRCGAADTNGYYTYVRTRTGGVWGNWRQFAMVEDSGWKNIVPLAGTAATGKYVPQYRKIGNKVELRGFISQIGEEGTIVFNLPVGYRPTNRIRVLSVGDYLENTMSICRILENGDIYMWRTNNTTGYLNLDCISFCTD